MKKLNAQKKARVLPPACAGIPPTTNFIRTKL